MISVFDIYKIGIGPSSSHTVGPMKAGQSFVNDLVEMGRLTEVDHIKVDVYGSLSLTGKGHHTDIAIILGLAGNSPESVDIDSIPSFIETVKSSKVLSLAHGQKDAAFDYDVDLTFHTDNLSLHENSMQIHALSGGELVHSKTYYSIGGGFIVDEENFGVEPEDKVVVPYEFNSAKELVDHCKDNCFSISALVMANERVVKDTNRIEEEFEHIWNTMKACMERGLNTEGVLPGPLRVPRRAAALFQQLKTTERLSNDPMTVVDWVNMYAFAVNEENAAGGRVVTAPTNGACGIIPAVLAYYDKFVQPVGVKEYTRYFAASGGVGGLFKQNASISGAEVGCQGEVGVACSMAAAGLAELMGASPEQVCMAAEIAMEHNLGLTCDPVAGQVQVPCIERNGIAAVKAINASRMALRRSSDPRVSLDKVIETMLETGKDMNAKYRETSQGGLAVKVIC
jgi:L-serine dehydratase